MSNSRNSVEALLRNLDHDFRMWCPKCKSTSVHVSEERGRWSLDAEYTFVCYTCGLRKYGEGIIYGLLLDMRYEWTKAAKDREAERARKAEEAAQKAKLREAISKHQAEQRAREIVERRRADEEARRQHREWLERFQTGQLARPFAPPPPSEPTPPPVVDLTLKERHRIRDAAYREANRERRRENDRLRRARLRAAEPVAEVAPCESTAERAKQRKRERDARYRAAKKGREGAAKPEVLPRPIIVPEVVVPQANKCAWAECDNETKGKSKYCSRVCSNKNAHAREMERKRSG